MIVVMVMTEVVVKVVVILVSVMVHGSGDEGGDSGVICDTTGGGERVMYLSLGCLQITTTNSCQNRPREFYA